MQALSKSRRVLHQRLNIQKCYVPRTPNNSVQHFVTKDDISLAIKDAEESVKKGDTRMAAVKWDIVDELWTEFLHQEDRKNIYNKMDALDAYCSIELDALECREYDL